MFERWAEDLRFGMVNHNLATTEVSMRLPFSGQGAAGNHRPMGVFAQRNCTAPVASLRSAETYDPTRNLPAYPGFRGRGPGQ